MIKCAVLGSPISHSLSPTIHERAYEILGWSWRYERHEVISGALSDFLSEHEGQFRGLSLTMPLKEEALSLIDITEDLAKRVSAVNTIVFDDLGPHGHNTDVQGFIDALSHRGVQVPEVVAVLGGGATARAAIAAVDGVATKVEVYSRSEHRAKSLVNSATRSIVKVRPWSEVSHAFASSLVIGTTPRGATDAVEISDSVLAGSRGTYFESLYSPWPTPLLAKWRAAGGTGLDGLDLLVWQAIGQLEVMSLEGARLQVNRVELHDEMRAAALDLL